MLNKFIGIGRWAKDVELRYSKEGKAVSNSTIAINDRFNKDNTTFLNVVIFGKVAENTAQFTGKGSLIALEGKIQTRSYENNQGQKVYITEVVAESVQFLDSRGGNSGGNANVSPGGKNTENEQRNGFDEDPFANDGAPIDISDDDLPF